jgi:hypothetical protein
MHNLKFSDLDKQPLEKIMRALNTQEVQAVAGGFLFLHHKKKCAKITLPKLCVPKISLPVCQPKPVCNPKPTCNTTPDVEEEVEVEEEIVIE